jgi:hypothetical protein
MTPEERFTLAEKTAYGIHDLIDSLANIGCYGEVEYRAAAELLLSLGRAMKILDPDKYKDHLSAVEAKARAAAGEPNAARVMSGNPSTGQYL